MNTNSLTAFRATIFSIFLFGIFGFGWGQNALNSGDFIGGSWGSSQMMSASLGGTLIITKGVSTAGDKYFRFYGDGSPCGEYQANNGGDYFDNAVPVTSPNANCGSDNAWRINVPTASSNVVFKTDGQNDGIDRTIAFVIQGAVRTISSVAQSPSSPTYLQNITVTANVSSSLSPGQGVYLRWSTNDFATSVVTEMTGSLTAPTAVIPAQSTGAVVKYYVFSSGSGLSISHSDADFYTINANNNSGSNYQFTPVGVTRYAVASGDWNSITTWATILDGAPGATIPQAGDDVIIEGGYNVSVTANSMAKSVTFNGVGTNSLTISHNNTLTLSGALTLNPNVNSATACEISGLGSLFCGSITVGGNGIIPNVSKSTIMTSTINNLIITGSGDLTLVCRSSGSKYNNPRFYLNSGSLTIPGSIVPSNVTSNSSQAVRFYMNQGSQNATLNLTGPDPWSTHSNLAAPWNAGSAVYEVFLNGTGSTVIYSRTGDQTINRAASTGNLSLVYTNLTISGSGNKMLPTSSTATVNGTFSIQGSATITNKAPSFGANALLEYKNAGSRTTSALEWPSVGPKGLIIDNGVGTITMVAGQPRTLTQNLTLLSGTLSDNGNALTLQGNILGSGTHSGIGSLILTGANKTISGAILGNLTLNNGSVFSLSGSPTINGALTFSLGQLSIGNNTLNIAGTFVSMSAVNNIIGSASSNLNIIGTGNSGPLYMSQSVNGTSNALNNFTVNRSANGIVSLGSNINILGDVSILNGSLRSLGANTFSMSGTTQLFTISNGTGGSVLGTDNSAGNDLTLSIASSASTTLTGDATFTNDDDKKFFAINVNAGSSLILQRGILVKYGTFLVNGTLQINSNGYLQQTPTGGFAVAPTYTSGANLIYNSGSLANAAYGRGLEWSSTSGAGYPFNVQISGNTILDLGNGGANIARQIAGNLTINSGSGLLMDFGLNDMSQPLTVFGNVMNNGILSLSENSGGGMKVYGNFTNDGTFNPYGRTIEFLGSTLQTVSGNLNSAGASNNFFYLTLNNPNGLVLNSPLLVANTLNLFAGTLDIIANTLTIAGSITNTTGSIDADAGTIAFANTSNLTLPAALFSGNIANLSKTSGVGSVTLNDNIIITNNLNTSASTGALILASGKQLTINGALTNNGTFTMESGATFKQGTSITGSGTFNVKQTVTGGNNGTAPNGRFWYMGVPMSGLTKGAAFGTASGQLETKVWQFIETAASGWGSPLSSSIPLQEGRGYAIRSGESNPTFTFSGNNLFTTDTTMSLSYTSGFGNGYHLLSNSYMAPISWEDILTSSVNISPTYWVRSYNGANQALIFDTYNATSNESVSPSLQTTNQYIAPLQSFWVRALPNQSVRSVTMTRAMTSHQPANVLKSSIDFPVYARINLVDDAKFDEALIYMNQDISTAFDDYDSEKMFVAGMAQIYTQVSNKKLVINGLKNNKKKSSIPLYLELPTSKVYQLQLNEFNMEEGLILLEDKLEGTIQDFTINDTYTFYASSGVLTNRFVLHFLMPDATISAQGPSNSWVNEEAIVNDGGSIQVSSNGSGIVTIQQDIDATATEKGAVVVRDASGREVYNSPLEGAETIIQLDAPSGVYFVEVSVQGQVEVKKIFIQE